MKSLLFILLAGYAVRCDENNYYVIEMPDDPPIRTKKPFNVYWNVPTMQCASKKIHFEKLYEKFGIIQNDNDRFKGEKVTILYDPGLFPALFKNETSGKFRFRNGGVPQEGNLDQHLDAFTKELDQSIPNKKFSGVGIIDFESWRPVFRQNFGELVPYKDVSIEIERRQHWWWKEAWIQAEAKRRFEEAARTFMQTTLAVAKKLRPRALWGFYGFPYCFNMASNNMRESCAKNVPEENDQVPWLWSESTALFPSVYSSAALSAAQLAALIRGRVREAARTRGGAADVILPYFWFRYRDAGFLTEKDLNMALATLYESKATGFLIWGSSNDVNTVDKCNKLLKYVENVFGPAIAKYTKQPNRLIDETNDLAHTTISTLTSITTERPFNSNFSNFNTKTEVDPEFDWTPPVNYTQDIKKHVEDEINKKFSQNDTPGNDKESVLKNNSILIDLILNTVLNSVDYANSSTTDTSKIKDMTKGLQEYLVSSTTQIDAYTQTSQVANRIITKSPFFINNSSTHVEIPITDTTSTESQKLVDISTTETSAVQPDTDKSSINSQLGFRTDDSITDRTTTVYSDYETAETDYGATFDDDGDYFFNSDIFDGYDFATKNKDFTTDATNFETKLSKNDKKEFLTTGLEQDSSKNNLGTTTFDDIVENKTFTNNIDYLGTGLYEYSTAKDIEHIGSDSTTENSNENYFTERNDVTESSKNSIITTNFVSIQTVPTTETPLIRTTFDEISKTEETSTHVDESTTKGTKNYKSESDSSILTTILNWQGTNNLNINTIRHDTSNSTENQLEFTTSTETTTEDLQSSKSTTSHDTLYTSTEKSETSESTKYAEETTASIVPTSTEQVVFYY